jgi:hypothetical protein
MKKNAIGKKIDSLTLHVSSIEEAKKKFDRLMNELVREYDVDFINKKIAEVSGGYFHWTQRIDHIDELNVFRVVKLYEGIPPESQLKAQDLSYPKKVSKYGRAHIPNHPVFYGSLDVFTSIDESKLKIGETFYISNWNLKPSNDLHAFFQCFDSSGEGGILYESINQKLSEALEKIPPEAIETFKYTQKRVTDLFKITSENFYNVTSAIAHKLLFQMKPLIVDSPILIYSSVNNKPDNYNLAIHHSLADDPIRFPFKSVLKCRKKKGNKIDVIQKGFIRDNYVSWKKLKIKLNWVDRNVVTLILKNEEKQISTNESYLICKGIKESVLLLIEKNYGNDFEKYILEEIPPGGDIYQTFDSENIQKTERIYCPIPEGILMLDQNNAVKGFRIRISYTISWV